jgi:hypothetical protein
VIAADHQPPESAVLRKKGRTVTLTFKPWQGPWSDNQCFDSALALLPPEDLITRAFARDPIHVVFDTWGGSNRAADNLRLYSPPFARSQGSQSTTFIVRESPQRIMTGSETDYFVGIIAEILSEDRLDR